MVTNAFNNVYKDKTVLITGHTGFKGSWLSVWLSALGARVIGLSKDIPTNPSLFVSLKSHKFITHKIGDVRNIDLLHEILDIYKPELVFHLAAQALVIDSYKYPIETYETNIIGTVKLLEACRFCPSVRSIVIVSSDKCYENKELDSGYIENDPMGGFDPYSSSKGCVELVVNAYRNSFFNVNDYGKTHQVSIASARAGNVFGGGDWAANRLIPDCIRSLIANKTVILRKPQSVRPWQHVLEPLSGYIWLAAKQYFGGTKYSGGWNFGPDNLNNLTVESIVQQTISSWGEGNYSVNTDFDMHEAGVLKLDISKAITELEWNPVFDINTAIQKTIEWYKSYYSEKHLDMLEFTLEQISHYTLLSQNKNLKWSKTQS